MGTNNVTSPGGEKREPRNRAGHGLLTGIVISGVLGALLAEKAARTQAEVGGEFVCSHGDPHMLRRLMRNLLENAQRYAAGSPIEATVAAFNQGARLRVTDRGPGIPEQERERIFEPFYRLPGMRESEDGGVGLGLALVRQIARRHGGDFRCVPREGGGTCFEVELPTG